MGDPVIFQLYKVKQFAAIGVFLVSALGAMADPHHGGPHYQTYYVPQQVQPYYAQQLYNYEAVPVGYNPYGTYGPMPVVYRYRRSAQQDPRIGQEPVENRRAGPPPPPGIPSAPAFEIPAELRQSSDAIASGSNSYGRSTPHGPDYVDYGAYTGGHGAFGWYSDHPVGGHHH